MKFPLKALVVAGAVAVSGTASAATANDFFIEVLDGGSTQTLLIDLGTTIPSAGPTANVNLATAFSSAWTSFTTAAGYTSTSLQFYLLGALSSGTGSLTVNGGATGFSGSFTDIAALNTNVTGQLSNTLGVGTSMVLTSSSVASWQNTITATNDFGTATGTFNGTGDGVTTIGLVHVTAAGKSDLTTVTLNSSGLLSYASAVPEPGSYALMVAGLLAVGTIVRRRSRG